MTSKAHIPNGTNFKPQLRADYDFYTTDPLALEKLLDLITFPGPILEPSAGLNSLVNVLRARGYLVSSSDIIKRVPDQIEQDFFTVTSWNGSIITNPPYKESVKFIRHALSIIPNGCYVAMFLKLTFLEGKSRKSLFAKFPPKSVYVFSERVSCFKEGIPSNESSAVAYCWIVWEKGWYVVPHLYWI